MVSTIATPLALILNRAFAMGCFPLSRKEAAVKPLLKKPNLDPNDLKKRSSYIPVPKPSEILEEYLNHQFSKFIEKHEKLDSSQFSFHSSHSTEVTLVLVVDNITALVDASHLSAEFDMISPVLDTSRLDQLGIKDPGLNLLK
ncbi:hypothetical protein NDU88_002643 [Pleurodeles waltl]|uniref:Uncharacterized protein n=1 Tax=Pleurodeles waltl TaxID=8319 RepID=A0AAV7KSN9_PLEWA|nr:hypothetical protein NDU88_002643 [Pleurodeles waltl]